MMMIQSRQYMMMRLLCIFWSISYSATTTGGIIRLCYYRGYIQYRNKPSKTKTNYAHHIAKIYNSNNGNIIYYILPSYKYYDVYRNVLINSLEIINDTLVFFLVFWIQCKIIQIGKNINIFCITTRISPNTALTSFWLF